MCCPSRATILTGLYSHNTGVYTNGDGEDPNGGYPAFAAHDDQDRTFPLALQRAGYTTGLSGKYLNHYDGSVQPGWDAFHSFVGSNARYYKYDWTIDRATPVDRWIGAFRDTLAAAGELDNTYFVFLSDNGTTWGDHRCRSACRW